MKAIFFARVSTQDQKKEGYSIPAQIEQMRKYSALKDLEVWHEFEIDESSTKDKRVKFDKVVSIIRGQKATVALVVETIDRLLRRFRELSTFEDLIQQGKLELHFVRENLIINAASSSDVKQRLHLGIMMASSYVNQLSDNVKRSIARKISEGSWIGKAPFGYRNVTNDKGKKEIEVDMPKATVVKRMFKWYAAGAHSFNNLRAQVKKDYAIKLSKGQVDAILNNTFYYGMMNIKGSMHPHAYPQIISKHLFDQVQDRKASFHKKKRKNDGLNFQYRGLIRCKECDCSITPERKRKKGKEYLYYHCTQYHRKHGAKSVTEANLTEQFSALFANLQIPEEYLESILGKLMSTEKQETKLRDEEYNALKRELAKLRKRVLTLHTTKFDEEIDENTFAKLHSTYQEREVEIINRLSELESEFEDLGLNLARLRSLIARAGDLFRKSQMLESRQMISLVTSELKLSDKRLEYRIVQTFANAVQRRAIAT